MDTPIYKPPDPSDFIEVGNGLFVPAPISPEEWQKLAEEYERFYEEIYRPEYMEEVIKQCPNDNMRKSSFWKHAIESRAACP